MEGDVAPLEQLSRLAKVHGAELIVDEAHATGVCGPQGRGLTIEHGLERETLATVHTCGKALASAGAFVCGGRALGEFLVNRARTFIFSTAAPPYLAGQIRAAVDLARQADAERAHLRTIAAALREGLAAAGLQSGSSASHVVPIILSSNERTLHVAGRLQENGFGAKAIRPPTVPVGTARIRVSLTCKITLEDVHRLIAVMRGAIESAPEINSASVVHA